MVLSQTSANNSTLAGFFTDERLVGILCRKRLEATLRNRREEFLSELTSSRRGRDRAKEFNFLPYRRHWPQPGRKARLESKNSLQLRSRLLSRYVLKELKQPVARFRWVSRLRAFINDVRTSALTWTSGKVFKPERIVPIPKDKPGNGKDYRVLALYSLKDSVIASGFASFLRVRLEPHLGPECIAFRSGNPPPSHHDGAEAIIEYANKFAEKTPLWVAECDIKGFFDSLRHDVARQALRRVIDEHAGDDSVVWRFMESFFAGYSFVDAVSQAKEQLKRRGVTDPRFGDTGTESGIGVAQGSAVSCVLANVVLVAADHACLSADPDQKGLYRRYCDDIVIMHPSREICKDMHYRYCEKIKELGLNIHEPKDVSEYSFKYWEAKSKNPYEWMVSEDPKAVPWVAFVGYYMRRDGAVRVRPKSIARECRKQLQMVDQVLSRIDRKLRGGSVPVKFARKPEVILYRAMLHLVSFSVGVPRPFSVNPPTHALCWINGFRLLQRSTALRKSLRQLDRGRYVALARLTGRILGLQRRGRVQFAEQEKKPKEFNESEKGNESKKLIKFRLRYPGRPLSYFAQFQDGDRANGVERGQSLRVDHPAHEEGGSGRLMADEE